MKTNYTIKNFAKRVIMAITIVLFAGNVWGATTDVSTITSNSYEGLTKFWSTTGGDASNYEETRGAQWYGAHKGTTFTATSYTNVTSISIECARSGSGAGTITITAGASSKEITSFSTTKTTETLSLGSSYTGTITITVNATANSLYLKSISVTYTPVARTVNFSATSGTPASTSLTEAGGGTGVTLPNVTPDAAVTAAGWGFYGWAEAAVGTETTTAPTIVGKAGETYYPEANTTLYAVYAKGEYTKVTSTSELNATDKYFFAAIYSAKNYIMTSNYSSNQLAAKQIDEAATGKYHAASINSEWCYTLEANSTYWHIVDCNPGNTYHYLDTYYTQWYGHSKDYGDPYTFTYSTDHWEIQNKYSSGSRYFGLDGANGVFKTYTTTQNLLVYKAATAPKYVSAPCLDIVTLSAGTETNATISSFSDAGVQTCSSTVADRQVTITVAAATGYEFLSTARLTFAKTSGTATAEYVSGPTGTGPYTWVYQFSKDDSGAGTFSITSATPKSYTITLNGNGATIDGTANVTATYNSATLSASITNPKKTHYMFQGWYSGSGGTGNLVINKDGELQANVAGYTGEGGVWTKDGATTLYAKWTEHSYTNYRTKCCDDPALAFDGEYNYQTFVREDIKGARGGNGSATVEQGKATLVLDYTTSSAGICTAEVKKLTGADKRSTSVAGSDVSNHTGVSVDEENKKVTFEIWTYGSSYPTNNGQGTYRIKLSQESASTYCDVDTYYFVDVVLRDKFVDQVNGNTTISKDGDGTIKTTPTEGDMDVEKNDDCHSATRRLLGWIKETDLQTIYGTPRETGTLDEASAYEANKSMVVAPGNSFTTSGVTWYAVWGTDNTPEP